MPLKEEAANFTLEFEVEVGGESVNALSGSSEWKEVVATDTSGGRVAIHVSKQDISELQHHLAKCGSLTALADSDGAFFETDRRLLPVPLQMTG